MNPLPLPPRQAATAFRLVAVLGLVAALFGMVAGWTVLSRTGDALAASLELTNDTLVALDASAGVAQDTVAALSVSLSTLESTTADLDAAFDDGEQLLLDLGDVVRSDVAGSLRAVEESLPGLIQVAGTVDTTLGALSNLPIGPTYDPDQSFGDGLQELADSLDGLPERLVEQADLIDATAAGLTDVGDGIGDLAGELAAFDTTLGDTATLLGTYDETISGGSDLVEQAAADLDAQLAFARIAVVLLGVAFAAAQIVPLQLAAVMHPMPGPTPPSTAA